MLLVVLILFLVVNVGLSALAISIAIDLPADLKRRGLIIVASVLTANSIVFLIFYALYAHGFPC